MKVIMVSEKVVAEIGFNVLKNGQKIMALRLRLVF